VVVEVVCKALGLASIYLHHLIIICITQLDCLLDRGIVGGIVTQKKYPYEKEIDGGIVTQKEISLSPPSVRKSHQIKGTTL